MVTFTHGQIKLSEMLGSLDRKVYGQLSLAHQISYTSCGIHEFRPLVTFASSVFSQHHSKIRPFKFFNYMADRELFLQLVEDHWQERR